MVAVAGRSSSSSSSKTLARLVRARREAEGGCPDGGFCRVGCGWEKIGLPPGDGTTSFLAWLPPAAHFFDVMRPRLGIPSPAASLSPVVVLHRGRGLSGGDSTMPRPGQAHQPGRGRRPAAHHRPNAQRPAHRRRAPGSIGPIWSATSLPLPLPLLISSPLLAADVVSPLLGISRLRICIVSRTTLREISYIQGFSLF